MSDATEPTSLSVRRLDAGQSDFHEILTALLDRRMIEDKTVSDTVAEILLQVRTRGDEAVLEYTRRFDRRDVGSVSDLEVSREQMQAALDALDTEQAEALQVAAERIRRYHERQRQPSW